MRNPRKLTLGDVLIEGFGKVPSPIDVSPREIVWEFLQFDVRVRKRGMVGILHFVSFKDLSRK